MNKAFKATFLGAAFALMGGGLALAAPAAHAANSNSATTSISNNYDSGGQGNWANDNFTRTLTFTQENASYCESAGDDGGATIPAGYVCDEVSVSDSGSFTTLLNAYQPNQGFTTLSNNSILNVVNGTFTGTDTWAIETASTDEPDPTLVTSSLNDNYTHPSSGKDSTSQWYLQAFLTAPTYVENTTWGWTYNTGCETWVDSSASGAGNNGFDGQSSPTSVDGNITGEICPTPPPASTPPPVTITFSSYGNNVNKFGNGFDVFKQHAAPNTPIVGWPATQHDPATHFLKEAEGSYYRFEYAPNGTGDGLCVSNPGNGLLVLRNCNANVWQEFSYSGGHVISAFGGGIINPDGTGAQLTEGTSATPWGGSNYTWTAFSSLPA